MAQMVVIEHINGALSLEENRETPVAEPSEVNAIYLVSYEMDRVSGGDHPRYGSAMVDPNMLAFLTISIERRQLRTIASSEVDEATSARILSFLQTQIRTQLGAMFQSLPIRPGLNVANGPWNAGEEYNRRVLIRTAYRLLACGSGVLGLWALCVPRRSELRSKRLFASLCPRCGYSTTGLAENRCPECGESLALG